MKSIKMIRAYHKMTIILAAVVLFTSCHATAFKQNLNIVNMNPPEKKYSIDHDTNVILHYGEQSVKAPFKLKTNRSSDENSSGSLELKEATTGFYISSSKTAIVYDDSDTGINVLISNDMGDSWEICRVTDAVAGTKFIGFTDSDHGWIILSVFRGMGREDHYIYTTSDGGKKWTEMDTNINDTYSNVLTGANFINTEVGYLAFRYYEERVGRIYQTIDGGLTWQPITWRLMLPLNFSEFSNNKSLRAEAHSPYREQGQWIFPFRVIDHNASDGNPRMWYLCSADGLTWGNTINPAHSNLTSHADLIEPDPMQSFKFTLTPFPHLSDDILKTHTIDNLEQTIFRINDYTYGSTFCDENDTYYLGESLSPNMEICLAPLKYMEKSVYSWEEVQGAASMVTHYFAYRGEELVRLIDISGQVSYADLNGDGVNELIASSTGSLPTSVVIYFWDETECGELKFLNVAETLHAYSAAYRDGYFLVANKEGAPDKIYLYSNGKWSLVPTM